MRGYAVTLLVLALLGGTAAAFLLTESLKLEPRPIRGARVTKEFGPPSCGASHAIFSFRLRRADRIEAAVVDGDGRTVRTLASGERRRAGRVSFRWNGVRDDGTAAADGSYRLRIELARADRTITIPKVARLRRTEGSEPACEEGDASGA